MNKLGRFTLFLLLMVIMIFTSTILLQFNPVDKTGVSILRYIFYFLGFIFVYSEEIAYLFNNKGQ